VRLRRSGHKNTSGVKFDYSNFTCPISYVREILEIGSRFQVFSVNFQLHMRRNGHKTISGQMFNPKFEICMGCFLFKYKFCHCFLPYFRLVVVPATGPLFRRSAIRVLRGKTTFVMQNFRTLAGIGGGVNFFWRNPSKGTSLSDFARFQPSIVQIRSRDFASGVCTKKGHYKKSQRGELPTQPNSTKIGIRVGVADVINHTTFDNDRSREGVQSYGGANP